MFDGTRIATQRFVHGGLQWGRGAAPPLAVGGDDQLGLGVVDTRPQCRCGESREHHRMHEPQPRTCQHRDDRLGQHRHVDSDPVTGNQAELGQIVGRLADLSQQLGVGDGAGVAGLALPVDGDAITMAGLHMPIDTVVGDIELAADEPLRERCVGPVEYVAERLAPVQTASLLCPEPEPIFLGRLIEVGGRVRCRHELRRRRVAIRFGADFGHLIWPFCPRQVRSKA